MQKQRSSMQSRPERARSLIVKEPESLPTTDAQESTFFKGLFKQMTTTAKHFCFSNDLQVNMCVRLMDSGRAPKEKNSPRFVSLVMDAIYKRDS